MRVFWMIIASLATAAVVLGLGRFKGDGHAASESARAAKNLSSAASSPALPPVVDAAAHPANTNDYIVGGSGTANDPFAITWDLLVLASETYRPRQGMTEIPLRVKAIDGRHIKIAGYFTAPVASTDSHEVLFMLNEWDGCCLGAPPTPYDGIEVHLKTPVECSRHSVTYGTLTGVIRIQPFVRDGWLLGMYVVEDGEIQIGM